MELRRRAGEPVRHDRERPSQRNAGLGQPCSRSSGVADGRLRALAERERTAIRHTAARGSYRGGVQVKRAGMLLLFAGTLAAQQSALDTGGPQAARIAKLWWFFLVPMTVIFLLVLGMTFWSLTRTPSRENE